MKRLKDGDSFQKEYSIRCDGQISSREISDQSVGCEIASYCGVDTALLAEDSSFSDLYAQEKQVRPELLRGGMVVSGIVVHVCCKVSVGRGLRKGVCGWSGEKGAYRHTSPSLQEIGIIS